MDPEQTFLRVHARLSGMLSQLLTPRIRLALEYAYFGVAVALFCLLVVMHTNFVQQPGCSSEFTGLEFTEAQLVQIKITGGGLWVVSGIDQSSISSTHGISSELNADEFTFLTTKFWSNWIGLGARRGKVIFRPWKAEKELLEQSQTQQQETYAGDGGSMNFKGTADSTELKAALANFLQKWYRRFVLLWRNGASAVSQMTQVMCNGLREEVRHSSRLIFMLLKRGTSCFQKEPRHGTVSRLLMLQFQLKIPALEIGGNSF